MPRPTSENPREHRLVAYVDGTTKREFEDILLAIKKARPTLSASDLLYEWVTQKINKFKGMAGPQNVVSEKKRRAG